LGWHNVRISDTSWAILARLFERALLMVRTALSNPVALCVARDTVATAGSPKENVSTM